ncbi:Hypothetical protein, partial CDS, partial [Neorhizobium galegae bv. officinalis]
MGRPSLICAGLAVMLAAAVSLPAFAQQPQPGPRPAAPQSAPQPAQGAKPG